jgi:Na+-translocating ferredoxin:NAD+ oxidoreductase RnfC subunit
MLPMTRLYVTLGGIVEVAAGTEIFQLIEAIGGCRTKSHGYEEKQHP